MTFFHRKRKAMPKKESKYEVCAICHKPTDIRKDTPIDVREHYVYGVGQLCIRCFRGTYHKSDD